MADPANHYVEAPLHAFAHARAGDKGERCNISVIPYDPEAYPHLLEQVTEARVMTLFAHRGASAVRRYELPGLPALNFVIDDVLQGGVNGSLNLDGHGKTLSFRLLELPVRLPARLVRNARYLDATEG
jgi:hypothetical protein